MCTSVENCFSHPAHHSHSLSTQSREEEGAAGVRSWHKALAEVRSSAQLSLCIGQLQKSINWERSISKLVSGTAILSCNRAFANAVSLFRAHINYRTTKNVASFYILLLLLQLSRSLSATCCVDEPLHQVYKLEAC